MGQVMAKQNKGGAKDGANDPRHAKKTWLFKSFEGRGNHLLSATESRDPETGRKVTTFKKIKPGNSSN
jgi:hypothetical protein